MRKMGVGGETYFKLGGQGVCLEEVPLKLKSEV